MRLSDASSRYLTLRAQEGYSSYTVKAYRVQHHLLIKDIGDVEIDTVTLEQLREHLQQHMHLKASSLGHKVRAIKSLFKWLVEEDLLVRNPTMKLKEPKLGECVCAKGTHHR